MFPLGKGQVGVGFGPFLNRSDKSANKLAAACQLPALPLEMRQDFSDFS